MFAIATAAAALEIAGRVAAHRGRAALKWLWAGAIAMGSGLFAMHLTGMLAYRFPIAVEYHLPTLAISWLGAVFAALTIVYVTSREPMTSAGLAGGSLAVGAGIAVMQFAAMAALRLAALPQYRSAPVFASIVLDILISLVGLLLISHARDENHDWTAKLAIVLVIGLAVPVVHYMSMSVVSFLPTGIAPQLEAAIAFRPLAATGTVVAALLILGSAVLAARTDRLRSVRKLSLHDEYSMLRALIDNMPDFMYVKDIHSRFVVANAHQAHEVGEDSPEKLLGKTDFDFFPHELACAYFRDEQYVVRSGKPLHDREEKSRSRDGSELDVLTTKVPVRDHRGRVIGVAGIGRDITARKKMEIALREAEQKYRGIFDNAIFGIFQSTPDGKVLSVNSAMAAAYGYDSPEEALVGVSDVNRQVYVDPNRRNDFKRRMEEDGAVQNFEYEAYRKDGSRIWLSMSARAIRENGVVIRYEGMSEDMTERKALREQLLQAQKLESVGQLAAGIAHEINTPTQYIGDNVRFLRDAFQDLKTLLTSYEQWFSAAGKNQLSREAIEAATAAVDQVDAAYLLEEIPRAIDQTLEGVSRVAALVNAMKEFSHPDTKEKSLLDLNRAIAGTITVARNEWKYVAELKTDFDPSLPPVSCHPGEFNQVILNLIVNAAHAIGDVASQGGPKKGTITVRTLKCAEWAEIRIEDTGTGIPEKLRTRIFDPFFTTKEIGKGTGQGLAIARSVIVDKHGGTLHFETEEARGTTFIIRLPYEGKAFAAKVVAA